MSTSTLPVWFPTTVCSRCGGSGHYSYNAIDGSRCYGCQGTGRMYPKAIAAVVNAYRADLKDGRETWCDRSRAPLAVGDRVWATETHIGSQKSRGDVDRGYAWRTVTAISERGEAVGWSIRGEERIPTHFKRTVTLDGVHEIPTSGQIMRRFFERSDEDKVRYQREAIAAVKPRAAREWAAALVVLTGRVG
jgi:hypothetical protein